MRRLSFVLSILFLSTGLFAQGFEWGIKTGFNLASQTKVDDAKINPGLYAGIFGEYKVSPFFGVQGELLYSMMGTKMTKQGIATNSDLNYITLPVMAKIYFAKTLSLDIGPQFGYMLNAKLTPAGNNPDSYYDSLEKFDLAVGIGLSFRMVYGLGMSARYNLGLIEFERNSNSKNGVIQLGLSYNF